MIDMMIKRPVGYKPRFCPPMVEPEKENVVRSYMKRVKKIKDEDILDHPENVVFTEYDKKEIERLERKA